MLSCETDLDVVFAELDEVDLLHMRDRRPELADVRPRAASVGQDYPVSLAAEDPFENRQASRIFVEEIARWQKQTAKTRGVEGSETGSVTFVQRFNGTLGSFVRFHVVVPDGVFTRAGDAGVTFHEERAPCRERIAAVAARVATRRTRWLRRRGLVDERPADEGGAPAISPVPAILP